jgi:RHS repeat-associated protein
MISKKNKVTNQLTDHLGNVRAVVSKDNNGNAAALVSATDYYPFGMAMPGRQIVNGQPYRYAYQGQEKDPETGKEAFQLRLWDARIGRWLTTDPYGQHASPYMGMGNNPITRVDPDGGFDWYKDADGNYAYDSNLTAENASSFLGAGETYVGESFYDFNALQSGSIDGIMTNLFDGSQTQFLDPITVFASSKTWDAVTNRRIKTLDSRLQQPATKFINQVESELGIQLRMTQAFRTFAEQDALYAQGRTKPGKIVTKAHGGRSYHNYGLAFDIVMMDNGKTPNWSVLPSQAVEIATDLGFEWGGNWINFKDYPHFQMVFGQTIKQLQSVHNAGKK